MSKDRYRALPRTSPPGAWEIRDDRTGKMYSYHHGIGCGDMAVRLAKDLNEKERCKHELSRETQP